jgi:hypothetical protein
LTIEPTTKNDLLDLAVRGHGGLDRWRTIETITATITLGGALFALKGRPDGLSGEATADTAAPRVTFAPFPGGVKGTFEADRVAVTTADGEENLREEARAAFSDHELATPWDDLHLLYFSGYAIWNYLCTPFLLARPGFQVEEIDPRQEEGETWRRLRVQFPDDVPTHRPEQVFHFDEGGLLRRLDYAAEVVNPKSPTPAAHYCHDHEEFAGLVVPTRRRVFLRQDDGTAAHDQLVVELDVKDVTLSP